MRTWMKVMLMLPLLHRKPVSGQTNGWLASRLLKDPSRCILCGSARRQPVSLVAPTALTHLAGKPASWLTYMAWLGAIRLAVERMYDIDA